MRIAAIGVGGAGCRIVDALYRDDSRRSSTYLATTLALDTDADALDALRSVPAADRELFGALETKGEGTGGDRASGAAALEADRNAVRRTVDDAVTSDVDAVVFVAGLAGGTGAGATPPLAESIREIHDRPVYAVGVLPADETPAAATTATRGLRDLTDVTDAQILFDNDAWLGRGESIAQNRDELNRALGERLGGLGAAGEVDVPEAVGESVVDASEITATLSGSDSDRSGLATIGWASQELDDTTGGSSLGARLREVIFGGDDEVDEVAAIKAVENTVRRAARERLTIACQLDAAARGLVVVSGPPAWLNRDAIMDSRSRLEAELAAPQVRGGDVPDPGASRLAVVVLLAGLTGVERVAELEARAE